MKRTMNQRPQRPYFQVMIHRTIGKRSQKNIHKIAARQSHTGAHARPKRGTQTSDKAELLIQRLLACEENLKILRSKSELGSSINTATMDALLLALLRNSSTQALYLFDYAPAFREESAQDIMGIMLTSNGIQLLNAFRCSLAKKNTAAINKADLKVPERVREETVMQALYLAVHVQGQKANLLRLRPG